MATSNASQSIAPVFTSVASPQIDDPEPQGTLPTGVVKHSDRPDNTKFWSAVRKAKTAVMDRPGRVDTLKLRRDILDRVMVYCSLTQDRVCYASVAKIAKKERAGTTSTRGHLRALERDGFLEAVGSRKGGRKTPTTYRPGPWFLHADEPDVNPTDYERKPNGLRAVNPTDSVAKYLVPKSTYGKKAAAATTADTHEVQQPPVQPPPLLPPQTGGLDEQNNPQPDTPDRHTCPTCQNTWPARFGPICYQCPQPTAAQLRRQKQKADNRESEKPWTPEELAGFKSEQLDVNARAWAEQDPPHANTDSPPVPPPSPQSVPATPAQAQKHIDAMRALTQRLPSKHTQQRRGEWTKLIDVTSQRGDEPQELQEQQHDGLVMGQVTDSGGSHGARARLKNQIRQLFACTVSLML